MTVLVIGRNGQVARCLAEAELPDGWRLVCRGRAEGCSITDPEALARTLDAVKPGIVVNASAYTAVDAAETDAENAYRVNRDGPAALAGLAAARGTPLIHFSTDYVFAGDKERYREDDPVAPLNVYGASKAAGETAVRERHGQHVILRTSWVYSPFGTNFVKTMLRLGESRPELRIVADQHGAPTSARDLAAAVVTIARRIGAGDGRFGTFHIAGGGETTWFGLAEAVFRHTGARSGPTPRLVPIGTAEYPTPARRPPSSRLDCSKLADAYGIRLPHWQESLSACLDELAVPRSSAA